MNEKYIKNKLNIEDSILQKDYNQWHKDQWRKKVSQMDFSKIHPVSYKFYNWILGLMKVESNKKILDVGCGRGLFLKVAKEKGLKIFGLDISDSAINKARETVKEDNFIVGNAEKMPYQNEEFDYITCLGSLEHFTHPEQGVQEISRVLKKDGIAIVYVPNLMFLGHIYMTYKYGVMPSEDQQGFSEVFYTHKGWGKLLEDNGLKVIDCRPYNRIYGTKKVSRFVVFLWENFIRFFTPFNLSYSFAYILKKK